MLGSSVAMPGSSTVVFGLFAAMSELSIPLSLFVSISQLFDLVSLSASALMLFESSFLPFPKLSLLKTPTIDLAIERQRLDDTINE